VTGCAKESRQLSDLLRDSRRRQPTTSVRFYLREAMLARILTIALCLSVSLSVTSRSSIETNERIELVLALELPSTRPALC